MNLQNAASLGRPQRPAPAPSQPGAQSRKALWPVGWTEVPPAPWAGAEPKGPGARSPPAGPASHAPRLRAKTMSGNAGSSSRVTRVRQSAAWGKLDARPHRGGGGSARCPSCANVQIWSSYLPVGTATAASTPALEKGHGEGTGAEAGLPSRPPPLPAPPPPGTKGPQWWEV